MSRAIFLLSLCSVASAFAPQQPILSHSVSSRIRPSNAPLFAATASMVGGVEKRAKRKPSPISGHTKPRITTISSAEEYLDFLAEDDRLCLVKFHASWCKTCQKFGMQYERIGREIGDAVAVSDDGSEIIVREGEIRLAEIEYGANQDLCKSLGVRKLPSVHIYSGGKLVEPVACGPKRIGMLLSKISYYKSLSLPELSFEADMNQGLALGETVLETLCADNEVSDSPSCLTLV